MNAETKRFLELYDWLKYKKTFKTHLEFAEMCDFSQATLSLILNGKRDVPATLILTFCIKFKANPSYIVEGKSPKWLKK